LQIVSKIRKELTANFHRLSVLLIHIEEKSLSPFARKVAMATFSEAKIQANFGTKTLFLSLNEQCVIFLCQPRCVSDVFLSIGFVDFFDKSIATEMFS